MNYLRDELGIHDGSLDVASDVYEGKYDFFTQVEIVPITRHYEVQGYPRTETRYGIAGYAGLWGRERAMQIGAEKAEQAGNFEAREYFEYMAQGYYEEEA